MSGLRHQSDALGFLPSLKKFWFPNSPLWNPNVRVTSFYLCRTDEIGLYTSEPTFIGFGKIILTLFHIWEIIKRLKNSFDLTKSFLFSSLSHLLSLFLLDLLHSSSSMNPFNYPGPYLTGPTGYPSPGDPTGMGYMMDGQHAAAAAMMQARPPGDASGYDYPHAAAAYSQYYSHL